MRVDIEGGKYTYIFVDGRARLLRYGEPSRRDVAGDKLIYCMAAEIAELRQQLAAALLWKEAVEHELIVAGIWNKSHENDPEKAVKEAIDWNVQVARDPKLP